MGGSRRGLIIAAAVLGSVITVIGVVLAGLFAVSLLQMSRTVPAVELARAVDGEVRFGGVTGATPARCPSGVRTQVGRSVRCSVTVDGQPVDVVVSVTSARLFRPGPKIGYAIRLEPNPIPKALLERKVGELVRSSGTPVDAIACAGDLPPVPGQRTSCTVTSGGAPLGVAVMTTGVDGGMVRFAIGPG